MKKRLFLILCIAALALSLAACSSPAPAPVETSAPAVAETPAPTAEPVALPNPIHETDAEGLVQATGIPLPAPEGAEDVRYCWIELTDGAPIAQMEFTLDGARAFLRAQPTAGFEPEDISGLYFDWSKASAAEVSYCKAALYTNGEAGYIAWVDAVPGLLYNLGMSQGASADTLITLANAAFVPVQGDADGEVPEEKSAARDERYALYWELIDKVAAGLRDGLSSDETAQLGVSDVFARAGAEELGWLLRDLNGDGVDELLFGRSKEGDELTPTYDIFCLLGGVLSHPATGWEFNCWYLLPDGMLINEWSGDGYDRYHSAYGYFNGSLIPGFSSAGREQYLKLDFQRFIEDET